MVRRLRQIGRGDRRGMDQPGQHRRCREHRHPGVPLQRVEDRLDLEMRQHDLMSAAQQVGQRIKTGAVRQRTGVETGVTLVEHVDVGVIAMAHKQQIAVAQHRTFGSAGRSARVKQPRPVGCRPIDRQHRGGLPQQGGVLAAACRDDRRQGRDRSFERCEAAREVRGGDQQSGAAIAGNMLHFPDMQPGVDRHCAQARRPAGEHDLEELGAILHAQNDPVAGFETARGETARQLGNAAGKFAVSPGVRIVGDRGHLGQPAGDIKQQRGEVHGDPRLGMTGGGWGGIRTHGELAPTPVFKTGALNRSATHPSR